MKRTAMNNGQANASDELSFGGDMEFFYRAINRLPRQLIGLISGKPGSCKSTLMLQCCISLAEQGKSSFILLSEEAISRGEERLTRLISNYCATRQKKIRSKIRFEQCPEVGVAQDLLLREIGNRNNGRPLDFVVLDSIHGSGLSSNSMKSYRKVTDLFHFCRTVGVPLFTVGHSGRDGSPLGNSVLFHDVDISAQIHICGKTRMLSITKNRNGQITEPTSLVMEDGTGRLIENPHTSPMSSTAKSILPGSEIAEVQAAIRLPKNPSDQGKVCAPGLPRNRVALALDCLQQIPELEMDLSNFTVSLTVPGDNIYSRSLCLPLVVAVANSYLRRPTPENHFFVGELDIQNRCRASDERILSSIENLIQAQMLPKGSTVVVPEEDARMLGSGDRSVSIVGVSSLAECLSLIEPPRKARKAPQKPRTGNGGGRSPKRVQVTDLAKAVGRKTSRNRG